MRGGRYFGVLAINACLLLGACGMDGGVIGYAAHNMGLQPSTFGLGPSAPSGAEAYESRKDSFTHYLATVNASCGTAHYDKTKCEVGQYWLVDSARKLQSFERSCSYEQAPVPCDQIDWPLQRKAQWAIDEYSADVAARENGSAGYAPAYGTGCPAGTLNQSGLCVVPNYAPPPMSPPPTCAGTIMSGQSCPY